jgi:hypothetical protein
VQTCNTLRGGMSVRRLAWKDASMSSDVAPDVSALAINVTILEGLRWTDTRRGVEFTLTTLSTSGSSRTGASR